MLKLILNLILYKANIFYLTGHVDVLFSFYNLLAKNLLILFNINI